MNYEFVKLITKQLRIIVCMEVLFQCEFVILEVDYRTITFIVHIEVRFPCTFLILELDNETIQ